MEEIDGAQQVVLTWDNFAQYVPGLKPWLVKNLLPTLKPAMKEPKLGDTVTILFSDKLRIQVFNFIFLIIFFFFVNNNSSFLCN